MTEAPAPLITLADLSDYQSFNISDDLGNHVLIMVRGAMRAWPLSEPSYTISLKLMGDFGCAEHFWSHAGGEGDTWWDWLEDCDRHYVLGKLFGSRNAHEFDEEASHKQVQRDILSMRGRYEITKEQAREAWDEWGEHHRDKETFYTDLSHLTTDYTLGLFEGIHLFPEYYEMGLTRMKPRMVQFWDTIWRPFIEAAKRAEGFTKKVPCGE